MSQISLSFRLMPLLLCVCLLLPRGPNEPVTLINLGADACFMCREAARQLGMGCEPLPRSIPVRAPDGHQLGTVSHQTRSVDMLLAGDHFHFQSSTPWTCLVCIWSWGFPGFNDTNPPLTGRPEPFVGGAPPAALPA